MVEKYEYRCKNCGHWYLFDEKIPESQVCKRVIPPNNEDCNGELEFLGEVEITQQVIFGRRGYGKIAFTDNKRNRNGDNK